MVRQNRSIGVDIGSGEVKVAVLERRGGKVQVAGLGRAELPDGKAGGPPPDPEAIARAIRNALEAAGANGSGEAICALPRHATIVRGVRLPGAPSEHLAQAAVLEATRTLPFAAGQSVTGVALRPTRDGHETLAEVAVARTELVSAYQSAMAMAGIRPLALAASSLAAASLAGEGMDRPWMLLDLGACATTADIFEEGVVRSSRTLLQGGEDLTRAFAIDLGCDAETAEERKRSAGLEALSRYASGGIGHSDASHRLAPATTEAGAAEAWLGRLVEGVRLLLSAHAAQGGAPPAEVRLAGGTGALAGLGPRLERSLGLPVVPAPCGPLHTAGGENPLQYLAAYALARAGTGIGAVQTPDLLAAETRQARVDQKRRARSWVTVAVCVVGLTWSSWVLYGAWRSHQETARVRAGLVRQLGQTHRLHEMLAGKKATLSLQAQALRAALRPEHPWVNVLNELAALAPQGVWLTGIDVERGKPLTIRGTALQPGLAADFAAALARSRLLDRAQLNYASDAEMKEQHVTQFGITALVRGNVPEVKPVASGTRRRTKKDAGEKSE